MPLLVSILKSTPHHMPLIIGVSNIHVLELGMSTSVYASQKIVRYLI